VSNSTVSQPEKDMPTSRAEAPAKKFVFFKAMRDAVVRRVNKFKDSLLPHPYYIEDENVLQVIQMTSYRALVPKILGVLSVVLLIAAMFSFVVSWVLGFNPESLVADSELSMKIGNYELWALLFLLGALYLVFKTVQTWLAYRQWQFIITDKRIIITTPAPEQSFFADSIYLADGTIKVLDTNFSKSPLWLPFQISSGARDVMLSTGGYEFMEKGAKVKGGIRFPDVSSEDVRRLEALVFAKKKA